MGKAQQCITGLAACFGAVLMGALNTWPSYTLEFLKSPETTVMSTPMTDFEASLVSSLPSLGAMAGTAVTGVVINRLGRKRGAMVLVLPFLISWLIVLEFSWSSIPIMVARFIGGVGGGSNLVYAPIFISEISEPSIRGALSSGTVALYCFGCILSYLAGWFLSYKMIIWLNLSLGVLNLFMFTFVVESPLFLLMKNNEHEATKALAHYRDGSVTSKTVLEELSVMKQQLHPAVELLSVNSDLEKKEEESEKLTQGVVLPKPRKQSAIRKLFTDRASRRAFLVVGTALTLQVWMGMVAVQVYAGDLFTRAAPNLSSDFCAVLLAVTLFAGGAVAAVVADRAGRRILIISSSAMVAFFMITLGAQIKYGFIPAWMTAVIVLAYCFCFIFGAGTVPYVLLAEVFTPEVQGIASMILVEWVWLLNFLIIAVFPLMVSMLGTHGSFYAFGCVGAVNTVLSYFSVPETKGMSNKQIQEVFSK